MLYIKGFALTSSTNKWKAFFSNFEFVFEFLADNLNIDHIAICYITINLSQRSLQTNDLF